MSKTFLQNYRSNDYENCKLPAINNNGVSSTNKINALICKTSPTDPCTKMSTAISNACTPSYENCKPNCLPVSRSSICNNGQKLKFNNNNCSSNQSSALNRPNILTCNQDKTVLLNQNNRCTKHMVVPSLNTYECSSMNSNTCNRQKVVVRDRQLANEILQKAGIQSNLTSSDCVEVITDTPVTINENVNCDPNPLCMKKPADCQECYEQPIVVRHLQPPKPPVPPPIIIRERCAVQPPPPSPIVIRQIPVRPPTPPPLIIRECPPPIPEIQEPTIIEREAPPLPPPPRQVIVERLPTPPRKPRPIIFEKWLPYEEPNDRPCIVEKAPNNDMPPPKNLIIQYEAREPKIESQCIDEGVSCVDPKQFVNDTSNGNAEVCYVNQIGNLPEHIKCQLSPQALAAIGIESCNQQNTNNKMPGSRTYSPNCYQQHPRFACNSMPSRHSTIINDCYPIKPLCSHQCSPNTHGQQQANNRALSISSTCLPLNSNKYNTKSLIRPGNQGLTNLIRTHYNPWATTYQVSYTSKARGMCRAR